MSIKHENRTSDRVIILGNDKWHEGVVGIIASRISEVYFRPSILLAFKGKTAKGSARSIPGFDITEALSTCCDLLIKYGGHSQAAGLEMNVANVELLRTRINEHAHQCDDLIFQKKCNYDLELNVTDITDDIVYFLKYFEPIGIMNPQPVFLGKNIEVVGIPRVVGGNHLKLALRVNNNVFDAIAYGQASTILDIEVGKTRVDCLYSISEDSYLGKRKIVLKLKDMKKTQS